MAARRMGIILFFLCFCFCVMPCCAQASSTADAKEPISTENECVLTLSFRSDGMNLTEVPVKLYHIADVSEDCRYTLSGAFADSGLVLNGIQTIGEWNAIRTTLEAYILSHKIQPVSSDKTDADGQVCFAGLKPGLYLAKAENMVQDGCTYLVDSSLIALPGLDQDGLWQYHVSIGSKIEVMPPVDPNKEIHWEVLKLWKNDSGRENRPASIDVEIFRNGISEGIVSLSEKNNWTYQWTAKDDGTIWKVAERNVPTGYTMTVEEKGHAFILTNRLDGYPPADPPKTGDTSHILLYTALMYVSGTALVLLGFAGKRKRNEKAE